MVDKVTIEAEVSNLGGKAVDIFDDKNCQEMFHEMYVKNGAENFCREMNRAATMLLVEHIRLKFELKPAQLRALLKKNIQQNEEYTTSLKLLMRSHIPNEHLIMIGRTERDQLWQQLLGKLICAQKMNVHLLFCLSIGKDAAKNQREKIILSTKSALLEWQHEKESYDKSIAQLEVLWFSGNERDQMMKDLVSKVVICNSVIKEMEATIKCLTEFQGEGLKGMNNQGMQPVRSFIEDAARVFEKFTGARATITVCRHKSEHETYSGKFFKFIRSCKQLIQAYPEFNEIQWPDQNNSVDQTDEITETRLGSMINKVLKSMRRRKSN